MKYGLYSIKDAKTGFMSPVLEQGDPAALRNFSAAVSQLDCIMHQYPNDFALYKVANWDTDTGVDPVLLPILIADASEVLRNER